MKKIILLTLILGISVLLWTPAMAKKELGTLPAPTNVKTDLSSDTDSICFSWDSVEGATKYSLDIAVYVDVDKDSFFDRMVEFSFGIGNRTGGFNPSDLNLCVPLSDFNSDLDGDDVPEQIYGTALVKVKALNPGKGNGRQNNAFSVGVEYSLSNQNSPPDPLRPPDSVTPPEPLVPPAP